MILLHCASTKRIPDRILIIPLGRTPRGKGVPLIAGIHVTNAREDDRRTQTHLAMDVNLCFPSIQVRNSDPSSLAVTAVDDRR